MAFQVDVVSAERRLFAGEASEVYARSTEGEIGILEGHQPVLLTLASAPVRVRTDDGDVVVAVHRGFLEYREDHCTVLADIAELIEDIDVPRARRALERAEQHLAEPDYRGDAQAEVERARLRLRLAQGDGEAPAH